MLLVPAFKNLILQLTIKTADYTDREKQPRELKQFF